MRLYRYGYWKLKDIYISFKYLYIFSNSLVLSLFGGRSRTRRPTSDTIAMLTKYNATIATNVCPVVLSVIHENVRLFTFVTVTPQIVLFCRPNNNNLIISSFYKPGLVLVVIRVCHLLASRLVSMQ